MINLPSLPTRPGGLGLAAVLAVVLAGCSTAPPAPTAPAYEGPPRQETVWAVTAGHELLRVRAGQPGVVQLRLKLSGLAPGERVLGMDYRVARGVLHALGSSGRIYTVHTGTGVLTPLGTAPFALPLQGQAHGFDFNPAADRIRIVGDGGQNLRAHPDTGALVDAAPDQPGLQPDGPLRYDGSDRHAGRAPRIEGAAYTYNKDNDKLTTNYAIDAGLGTLVTQGSVEGRTPAVSPNTGLLFTVGSLGLGPVRQVSFDIADINNVALAALSAGRDSASTLHVLDLATGQARRLGVIGDGTPVVALAIEP